MTVFDPVFSKQEKEILNSLECKVPEENMEGKYNISEGTLAYFPHCPHELTDAFLSENFTKEKLLKIVLLCNSFERFTTSEPSRIIEERAPFIGKIVDFSNIFEIENNYKFEDVFNDTAIHSFLEDKLPEEGTDFWDK